jgi:hypothetical protein
VTAKVINFKIFVSCTYFTYLQIVALFNQILLFKQKRCHYRHNPCTISTLNNVKPFLCVKIKAEIPSEISSDKVVGCDQHDIYLFFFFSKQKNISTNSFLRANLNDRASGFRFSDLLSG